MHTVRVIVAIVFGVPTLLALLTGAPPAAQFFVGGFSGSLAVMILSLGGLLNALGADAPDHDGPG